MRAALLTLIRCIVVLLIFFTVIAALVVLASALLVETYGSLFVLQDEGEPSFRTLRGLDLLRDAVCLAKLRVGVPACGLSTSLVPGTAFKLELAGKSVAARTPLLMRHLSAWAGHAEVALHRRPPENSAVLHPHPDTHPFTNHQPPISEGHVKLYQSVDSRNLCMARVIRASHRTFSSEERFETRESKNVRNPEKIVHADPSAQSRNRFLQVQRCMTKTL